MNPKFRRHFKLSIVQLNRFCSLDAHSRSCENDGACTGECRELKLSAFWVSIISLDDFVNYVFFIIQWKLSFSWSVWDLFNLYLWVYVRGETAWWCAVILLLTSDLGGENLVPNSYGGVPRETAYLTKVSLCVWETHFPVSLSSVTNG